VRALFLRYTTAYVEILLPVPDTINDVAEAYKKENQAYNQQYDMNDYF
jgi:hypothetical protein